MSYKFTDSTTQIGIARNNNTGNWDIKRSNDQGDLRESYQRTHTDYTYVSIQGPLAVQIATILVQNTAQPGADFTQEQVNVFADRLVTLAKKSIVS